MQKTLRTLAAPAVAASGAVVFALVLSSSPAPVQASSKQAQAVGAAIFSAKGCQHCHGDDLSGTDRGPDLSAVGKKWHKDQIERQIREGGNGMPAFNEVLQPDEVKSLVDFLAAKRKPAHKGKAAKPTAPAKPPTNPSDDNSGE